MVVMGAELYVLMDEQFQQKLFLLYPSIVTNMLEGFGLFVPEAFHIENYTESPNNVGVSFINKNPRYLVVNQESTLS